MLQYDLTHYHLPQREKGLVFSYCCNLLLCFSTKEFTTGYIRVEKGIITGCTISVILFVLDMNLILKAVEEETRGPKVAPGIQRYPNIRTLLFPVEVGCRGFPAITMGKIFTAL